MILYPSFKCLVVKPLSNNVYQKRCFWAFLDIIFNRYNKDRVEEVGPDRACAEWLLRNGAKVLFEGENERTENYNSVADLDKIIRKKLIEIDGSDSPITHHGFEYLKGCKYLRTIKLHNAFNIGDEALQKLKYAESSLHILQVSRCGNVTDKGVISLADVKSLQDLILFDLIGVRDWKKCERVLKDSLVNCHVVINKKL